MAAHPITPIPVPARVITMALSMITISVLAFCLTRRIQYIENWRTLPAATIIIITIYIDSFLFVFCTAILSKAFSLNQSHAICDGAILLCLICYMSTKVCIYYFLVEKIYIIRSSNTPRLKNKLWCFNVFGVICPYVALVVLNFAYRIAYLNKKGTCVIGMQRKALVPLISFEVVQNVYLTSLFIHPLRQCYSYKHTTSSRLKTMVVRNFIGSCVTLAMSVANLSVLTALDGEPGYVCLALCNIDILFSVLVLHWATSIDRQEPTTNNTFNPQSQHLEGSRARISMMSGKGEQHELQSKLTTKIGANKSATDSEKLSPQSIEVRFQRVQEIEITPSGKDNDQDTQWGRARSDSQEQIMPASAASRPEDPWNMDISPTGVRQQV